jgi:osmotically inducible protein OsmC
MATQKANAIWNGDLKSGKGNVTVGSGALDAPYSFKTRFEGDNKGTNPEELIGAAHAGCFSMFLANVLAQAGHPANNIRTEATVQLDIIDKGPLISRIELVTEGDVPGINEGEFQKYAQQAKEGCPVSQALKSVPEIKLTATLK